MIGVHWSSCEAIRSSVYPYIVVWGFPKIRRVPFWDAHHTDFSILGSMSGSPCSGKLPYLCRTLYNSSCHFIVHAFSFPFLHKSKSLNSNPTTLNPQPQAEDTLPFFWARKGCPEASQDIPVAGEPDLV